MSNVIDLRSRVALTLTLELGNTSYTVEFSLPSVVFAEQKLGRALRYPGDWYGAKAEDIPVFLEAGLRKHHPDLKAEDVRALCEPLTPEALGDVAAAFGALAFPKWTAGYKQQLEELRTKLEPTLEEVAR